MQDGRKIAILVDGMSTTRWQAEAIRRLGPGVQLIVYNCTNEHPRRRQLRHYPYYLVNLLALRTWLTRQTPLEHAVPFERVDFEAIADGNWQRLPGSLIDRIKADRPDAILKFGLGLLKVPDDLEVPILSYHHGDPRKFRGRPAGFYELLNDEDVVGQIIQVLSNRLDSGRVVAYAETPVLRSSYRATMLRSYAVSPLLLDQALTAIADGTSVDIAPAGPAYRLPSAGTVVRFAARRLTAKIKRLIYGGLVEKHWNVARTPLAFAGASTFQEFPGPSDWSVLPCPSAYQFIADPFAAPDGGILVEGLRSSTGLGEILHLTAEGLDSTTLLRGKGHFSYPGAIRYGDKDYICPEVCQWSFPELVELSDDRIVSTVPLKMVRPVRLVDPTLFTHQGFIYLFANNYAESDTVLRLWFTHSFDEPFQEHPCSPILISPKGGRMAGLLIDDGGLHRVGQDGSRDYGDGVHLFRVDDLSPATYRETKVGSLRFTAFRGPHTINFRSGQVLFDFYTERFTPLAGVRRLRNRMSSRRPA